jgi:hypothetical protein
VSPNWLIIETQLVKMQTKPKATRRNAIRTKLTISLAIMINVIGLQTEACGVALRSIWNQQPVSWTTAAVAGGIYSHCVNM